MVYHSSYLPFLSTKICRYNIPPFVILIIYKSISPISGITTIYLTSDMITTAAFHEAFKYFCNKHNLAVMSMIQFGKAIKETKKFQEDRETTGKRRTLWTGIRLTEEYLKVITNFNGKQIKLEDLV